MKIHQELASSIAKYRRLGRINYYSAFFFYGASVVSSAIATIMVLSNEFSGSVEAIFTAIPGGSLLIASNFRFSERSNWHYNKKIQLNALYRLAMTNALGTSPPEIAEKWNKIDKSMELSWPGFGAAGIGSANSRKRID